MTGSKELSGKFKLFIKSGFVAANATDYFLLFLLSIINFYPLFFGGFTTHDDAVMAITGWSGHTWEMARLASVAQGRFVFHWGFPFSGLPFVIDNRVWYIFIKYGSFFLLLAAIYYSVSKLFRSTWIAFASLAFFCSILQNGWEHNAVTSYAFIFNAYAVLFLASLGLFATALDNKRIILASSAGVLYFFALGTELFVLFFPIYFAVILSRVSPNHSVFNGIKIYRNYIYTMVFSLASYLTIYLAWRFLYPSRYDGNSLNSFGLIPAIKVIWTYGINAFPLSSLHRYFSHRNSLWFYNYSENIAVIIKPIIVGALFYRLMYVAKFSVPSAQIILVGAVLAGVSIFLPSVLLGFTEKHQSWVAVGVDSYVYTYYSFVAAVIFCSLLLSYAKAISQKWCYWKRLLLVAVVVVSMMIVSFTVEVSNQQYALNQKLSHRRWQLMDTVVKSPSFMGIKDGSIVFAPTLISSNRNIAVVLAEDWSNYVKYKTGKNIQFSDKNCISKIQCYTIVFRQELYTDNQYIVLARDQQANSKDTSELVIFANRPQPRAVVLGSFYPGRVIPEFWINGKPIKNIGAESFSAFLPDATTNEDFSEIAHITSNVTMMPERIAISNYGIEPRLRSFSEQMADGIDFTQPEYPEFLAEVLGMSTPEAVGRWTDETSHPSAEFRFKEALPRKFTLEITAGAFGPNMGAPFKVRVGDVEKELICTPELLHESIGLDFETDGTTDTIIITPFQPTSPNEIDSKNTDRRKLGINLVSLKIKTGPSTFVVH